MNQSSANFDLQLQSQLAVITLDHCSNSYRLQLELQWLRLQCYRLQECSDYNYNVQNTESRVQSCYSCRCGANSEHCKTKQLRRLSLASQQPASFVAAMQYCKTVDTVDSVGSTNYRQPRPRAQEPGPIIINNQEQAPQAISFLLNLGMKSIRNFNQWNPDSKCHHILLNLTSN